METDVIDSTGYSVCMVVSDNIRDDDFFSWIADEIGDQGLNWERGVDPAHIFFRTIGDAMVVQMAWGEWIAKSYQLPGSPAADITIH